MIPEWTVETRTGLRKKKDDILIDLKRERRKRKTLTRRKSAKPKMDFSENSDIWIWFTSLRFSNGFPLFSKDFPMAFRYFPRFSNGFPLFS